MKSAPIGKMRLQAKSWAMRLRRPMNSALRSPTISSSLRSWARACVKRVRSVVSPAGVKDKTKLRPSFAAARRERDPGAQALAIEA